MHDTHPTGRTKPMTVEFSPVFVARALRWAMIEANVSALPEGGVEIVATDGRGDVGVERLLSALLLAYIDAGSPTATIMDGPR